MSRHDRTWYLTAITLAAFAFVGCSEAPTAPDGPDAATASFSATAGPAITSPAADEVVFANELTLEGADTEAADNDVLWALRAGTCARSTGTVAGNVDGFDDDFDWTDGVFSAGLDASSLDAGAYCFVMNTTRGPETGNRLTQEFFLVDEYMKIGGTIDLDPARLDPSFRVPGGPFSHAFEGVVGNAGAAGTVGAIVINYRWHGEHCTFEPGSLTLTNATGVGVTADLRGDLVGADGACDDGATTSGAHLIGLDREGSDDFPRGAVIVRWEGAPSTSNYEIDGSAGSTGADSWVALERGNVHVGTR